MSLATYLLVPSKHIAAFKQRFFSVGEARRYTFLPEEHSDFLLRHTPQPPSAWLPVIIQIYDSGATLLDKGKTAPDHLTAHKAALYEQDKAQKIATLEYIVANLRPLGCSFGFGIINLSSKTCHGWQQRVNITEFPARYCEGTLYWFCSSANQQ